MTAPRPVRPLARRASLVLALLGLALAAAPALAKDEKKEKKKEPPKTGVFQVPAPAPAKYLQVAIPKEYDAAKQWPLLFVLHPSDSKPDDYVNAWWEEMQKKGWIVAGPMIEVWDNEESVKPVMDSLARVKETWSVDDRRVVLAGHNAGANMAWRMATRQPEAWAAVAAFSGEITDADRGQLKKFVGKPVYLFRGAKDTMSYTAPMLDRDKKVLDAWKIPYTVEVRPDWLYDFPRPSLPTIAAWVDGVWPPGEYRAKATAVQQALEAKDVPGAAKAHADLLLELKKTPYPAYEARAAELGKAVLDLSRSLISDAKALVEADPLEAVVRMEAVVKATRGLKPVDAEASAALAALKKDPKVVAAVRKKEAEALAVTYIGRADAAEAKGDLVKALEWFKKAAALGDTSKKAEADAKVAELEAKVGGK